MPPANEKLSAKLEEFQALLRSIAIDSTVQTQSLTVRVRQSRLMVTCKPGADQMTRLFQAWVQQSGGP